MVSIPCLQNKLFAHLDNWRCLYPQCAVGRGKGYQVAFQPQSWPVLSAALAVCDHGRRPRWSRSRASWAHSTATSPSSTPRTSRSSRRCWRSPARRHRPACPRPPAASRCRPAPPGSSGARPPRGGLRGPPARRRGAGGALTQGVRARNPTGAEQTSNGFDTGGCQRRLHPRGAPPTGKRGKPLENKEETKVSSADFRIPPCDVREGIRGGRNPVSVSKHRSKTL